MHPETREKELGRGPDMSAMREENIPVSTASNTQPRSVQFTLKAL
jgi:hypothetical protein